MPTCDTPATHRPDAADRETNPANESGSEHPGTPQGTALPLLSAEFAGRIVTRLGLAFVLVGLAFLFRWSVAQGWIGPVARVALGGVTSGALIAAGVRVRARQHVFAALLQGGGLAGLYLSIFAAHRIYGLVGDPGGYAALLMISAAGVGLSLHERAPSLAVVGLLGAALTPAAMAGFDGFATAQLHMAVVVTAAAGLYLATRWTGPMVVAALGFGLQMAVAVIDRAFNEVLRSTACGFLECAPLQLAGFAGDSQIALGVATLGFWAVPVWAAYRDRTHTDLVRSLNAAVLAAAVVPVAAYFGSRTVWQLADSGPTDFGWASVAIFSAAGMAWMVRGFDRAGISPVANAHRFSVTALTAAAVVVGFDGVAEVFGLALIGAGLITTAFLGEGDQDGSTVLDIVGQLIVMVTGLRAIALTETSQPGALGIGDGAMFLGVVAVYAAVAYIYDHSQPERRPLGVLYGLGAHLGMLYWVEVQFGHVDAQSAVVTIAWAAYALTLVTVAAVADRGGIRAAGLTTLAIAVAKLVFVDLASISTGWKVVLFMSFGVVMLAVGYWLIGRDETVTDHSPDGDVSHRDAAEATT